MRRVILMIILLLGVNSAQAFTLLDLKQRGLVGERSDGYIGIITFSEEVQAFVEYINLERTKGYQQIALETNQRFEDVKKFAAAKLIRNIPYGQHYYTNNTWKKR